MSPDVSHLMWVIWCDFSFTGEAPGSSGEAEEGAAESWEVGSWHQRREDFLEGRKRLSKGFLTQESWQDLQSKSQRSPFLFVPWHRMRPEAIWLVLLFVLSLLHWGLESGHVTSTHRYLELRIKTDSLVRKDGKFCLPFLFSNETLTPPVKDTGQRTKIFPKVQTWKCGNAGRCECPIQPSTT